MKKLLPILSLVLAMVIIPLAGCSSPTCDRVMNRTQKNYVNVGLNPDQMEALFNEAHTKKGKITKAELSQKVDFKEKNLLTVSGADAFMVLFGTNVYQGEIKKVSTLVALSEIDQHVLVQIPCRAVTNVNSRIYMNRQTVTSKGPDMKISLLFRDDVLVYASLQSITYDTKQINWRFGGGLIDLINEVAGAIKTAVTY